MKVLVFLALAVAYVAAQVPQEVQPQEVQQQQVQQQQGFEEDQQARDKRALLATYAAPVVYNPLYRDVIPASTYASYYPYTYVPSLYHYPYYIYRK